MLSFILLKRTPESAVASTGSERFDWIGFIAFLVAMVALNIFIGQGTQLGWTSPVIIALAVVFVIAAVGFFKIEVENSDAFVDLTLFRNKTYAGATMSNFLLNGGCRNATGGADARPTASGASSLESGLLTLGYLIAILSTIRVGENLLQKWGARKPMLLGCAITAVGILLTSFTFLLARPYLIVAFLGFTLFGIGLGLYATPSTDAALSNVPEERAGAASGIYKMASSLGAAFGVGISASIYTALEGREATFGSIAELFQGRTDNMNIRFAASMALIFNVLMVVTAIISIVMTIPKKASVSRLP